jgi:hypothetical protein
MIYGLGQSYPHYNFDLIKKILYNSANKLHVIALFLPWRLPINAEDFFTHAKTY